MIYHSSFSNFTWIILTLHIVKWSFCFYCVATYIIQTYIVIIVAILIKKEIARDLTEAECKESIANR